MPRTYYTLFCRDPDGVWSPQFGDYVRKVVRQEELDCYTRNSFGGYAARDRKIIRHPDTPAALHQLQDTLNPPLPEG
jgi:hypothetical protein